MLHNIDLNLLRALDLLLRERSVTRAAERLHVTQQAVSGTLRRLRAHFDDELLERAGREMRLTPRAEGLLGPIHDALVQIDHALQPRARLDSPTVGRCMAVAISDCASFTILPEIAARLASDASKLALVVQPLGETTLGEIENGKIDLFLSPGEWRPFGQRNPRGLRSTMLLKDDYVCVTSIKSWAANEPLETDRYLAMAHAALRCCGETCSSVEAAWHGLGLSPRVAVRAPSVGALFAMVAESPSLIATVERRLACRFREMLPLRVMECPIPIDPFEFLMHWPRSREHDPTHRRLRDLVSDIARAAGHKERLWLVQSTHQKP